MRKIVIALALMGIGLSPTAEVANVYVYKVTMTLNVPRVYDNMQSKGYRKMNRQRVVGYLKVDYRPVDGEPSIYAYGFENRTHRVSGKRVTYSDSEASDVMWRYIGSNRTGVFRNTNARFSLDLDPSYNVGPDEPDNALIITLSGYGTSEKSLRGSVTGQIGCGCSAYGHVSPTRTIEGKVDDIVPLYGSFEMRRVKSSTLVRRRLYD